jgi:hypothetical protein
MQLNTGIMRAASFRNSQKPVGVWAERHLASNDLILLVFSLDKIHESFLRAWLLESGKGVKLGTRVN